MFPHPLPLVPCRPARTDEIPRNAGSLVDRAADLGWRLNLTYAKGMSIDRAGEPTKVVESIVLRLRRGLFGAVGCWLDGKFAFAWIWSRATNPERVGARELTRFVKEAA